MNRRHFAAFVAVLGAVSFLSGYPAEAAVPAKKFVKTAGVAGMFEIESSKIALTKTKSPDIKAFAERMIQDHTMAAAELAGVAKSKYRLPEKLDKEHQALIKQLQDTSEPEFDKLYAKMQTQAHEQAVALFSDYSTSGDDAPLKAFAAKTLPVLEHHYAMIKDIDAKLAS